MPVNLQMRVPGLNMPGWLLATLVAFFFLNLNGFLLFDHDEGAFSEATRGMFERGDFITTWLNDRVRFDKPILIYWLQAASISLFGTEVWAFRLPSALAGLGWSLAIFAFCRRYLNEATATVAALMAAAALGINTISHVATADALLNAILATTLLIMYGYSQSPSNKLLYAIYALMALGVLTKGPVAVAIPLMVSALFFLSHGLRTEFLRAIFFVPGWILFIVIAAPWYIAEYMAQGQAFIDGFFLKHNVNRFNNAMEGHDGGFLFYPLVLPFVLAPFGGLLFRILPSIRNLKPGKDALDAWLWIWFLVVLILFSLASTKLPHYILYGCTPLVILMARYRHWLHSRLLALVFPLILFAVMIAFPLLLPLAEQRLTNPIEIAVAQRAAQFFNQDFSILAAVAALISAALILWKRFSPWFSLILVGAIQALFVWFLFIPAFSESQQRPVWEAAQFARTLNEPVYTQSIDMPSFNVYLDKVTERRRLNPGEVGFGREDRLAKDEERLGIQYQVLFQSGPIQIVRRTDGTSSASAAAEQH
ncbi:ArnT family glycosyltransferase [Thalassolituus marinus]|uniref:Glycosyltransferase family 39 protein n=1 Tax=Thalassolituus marinus TaxID=671053 RepID=A0ABS7ZMP6_9GAMM|nr:glycosyltransferase family 39 protein [Thalassolituus marinus]MCA6062982.1 glycosyltransferase family 39 protein [Thalassolituus marinus]